MEIQESSELVGRIIAETRKVIVGQDAAIRQVAVALMTGGNALIEGVPGTAKTLMVRVLSRVMGTTFRRIQFTPDLMPSDIVGVNVYNTSTGAFVFRPGPIFADTVLADEINRAPAKTQSALLEAMEEQQVTVDGETHLLPDVFSVFATQNPVELEGTYPLPEAQVDRFMLKIVVGYPDEEQESQILDRVEGGFDPLDLSTASVNPVIGVEQLMSLRECVRKVRVEESVRRYVTHIIRASRKNPEVMLGCSPRAGVMLMLAAKAEAVMAARDYVTPDDVKNMALPVLRHRLVLLPEMEVEGRSTDDCLRKILQGVEAPH